MRWISNLKRITKEILNNTYVVPSEYDAKNIYDYYVEQYDFCEEDLTVSQADKIEDSLMIFRTAILNVYPGLQLGV